MPNVEAGGISTNATPPAERRRHAVRDPRRRRQRQAGRARELRQLRVFSGASHPVDAGPALEPATRSRAARRSRWSTRRWRGSSGRRATRSASSSGSRNIKDEPPYSPAAAGGDGWIEIVGIVADARNDGLRNAIKPAFYVPYTLKMRMFTQILVRARVPPLSMLRDIRAELVRVDREQQVMRVRDLNGWITNMREYAQQKLVARLFGIFSLLALALSAVGLYSVVSYGVATRTNEFGIRMALGARARDVVRMVLSGTFWNVAAGLRRAWSCACSSTASPRSGWPRARRIRSFSAASPCCCSRRGAVACLAPARRAASIDPMEAVRHE